MENISNLIVTAVAVIGAITAAIIGGLTIWTFRDIRSRSRDFLVQILATVMVGVVPVAGILVYFMLRPRETLAEAYVRALEEESLLATIEHQEFCPSCGRRVETDMVFCPTCHTTLRHSCPNCHRAVHLSWDLCPYCGETLQPELPAIGKPKQSQLHAPQNHPGVSLPPSRPHESTLRSVPASTSPANGRTASNGFIGLLDKVGGAIEGLVDRVSPRTSGNTPEYDAQPSQPAEPEASPSVYSPQRPPPDTKPNAIKPLISRDEPLE
ncbi:MAG TPA: zinc ribbon domain-containing protein [Anaerolineae bacterium]|jgi:hypothetical protein